MISFIKHFFQWAYVDQQEIRKCVTNLLKSTNINQCINITVNIYFKLTFKLTVLNGILFLLSHILTFQIIFYDK